MVMLMNGYNLNDDYSSNESGLYCNRLQLRNCGPILKEQLNQMKRQELIIRFTVLMVQRSYIETTLYSLVLASLTSVLVNMLEFDTMNSFHLHGNMFEYYPAGTGMNPSYTTDIVELGQGDRGIMEFTYTKPGMYMFHAHINKFAGSWMDGHVQRRQPSHNDTTSRNKLFNSCQATSDSRPSP